MRFVIFLLFPLLIDLLAFQAVRVLLPFDGTAIAWIVYLLYWIVPVAAVGFFIAWTSGFANRWPRALLLTVQALIMILYVSKLLVAAFVLLDDARRVVAWMLGTLAPSTGFTAARLPLMSQLGMVIGSLPLLVLTYGLVRNRYRYKVFSKDIRLPHLPEVLDGLRIVQISDIHAGSFTSRVRVMRSVEMINALRPDIVVFTGDLVNHTADEANEYVDVFCKIASRHGVYSIVGNHDYGDYVPWPDAAAKRANFSLLKQHHRSMGWTLLLNAHRVLDIGGSRIGIVGVENFSAHPRFPKYGNLMEAVAGMEQTDINILLSHDPSHWDAEVLQSYPSMDITLSGHTHGFQFGIEWGNFFRWSPVQYVYKRWAGLYREGNQYLYVNRGLGYIGYPGRVGILPEITLLTLRRAEVE